MRPVVRELPPNAPRQGNALTRAFGRALLRLCGWHIDGEFPDLKHLVIIVAPHSSAWDAVWGIAGMLALGVRITFMAKAELFRGPLGWLLHRIGGVPVDRSRAHGAVEQAAAMLKGERPVWFLLAPEGTRRKVKDWKSGFWHIARNAGVPVLCAHFHYPEKRMGLGPVMMPTEDAGADMAAIREHYRPFIGKQRGTI